MWSESRGAGLGRVDCFNALGFLNPRIERVVAHIYVFGKFQVFCYSIEAENLGWIESKQNEQIKMANDQESGCISPG
jgi:hypothetical protein